MSGPKIDVLAAQRKIDRIFEKWTRPGSPGAVVGLMSGRKVWLTKGYGLANVEHEVPIGPQTRFRIASVSKQFTVAAILMLAEEGKLSLDDDVRKHLPRLPQLRKPVTIDQMARNVSGLPDVFELLRLGRHGLDVPTRAEDFDAAFERSTHLNFDPGSRFLYCNTGFVLLGRIAEKIEGKPLPEVLEERIFGPLGMTRTALVLSNNEVIPDMASGYLEPSPGKIVRAVHQYPHGGEGGLVSTVEDLLIWSRNYDRSAIGFKDLPKRLAEAAPLSGGTVSPYLRGLETENWRGIDTVEHGGLWPGFRTQFLRLPEVDLTVVVIANLGSIDPWKLTREVAAVALAGDKKLKPRPAPPSAAQLAAMTGSWLNAAELSLFDFAVIDGRLQVTQNGVPFTVAARDDGWLSAERGAFEFAFRAKDKDTLEVDLGAGRVLPFERLAARSEAPADLARVYRCDDIGATWTIATDGEGLSAQVAGPLMSGGVAWPVRGVLGDTIELTTPSPWLSISQIARLERDAEGKPDGLTVSTARIKNLRFRKVG